MEKPTQPKILVVAKCIIRDSKKNILLVQRSGNDPHEPKRWELPGGKIEEGEDMEALVEREVNEETGLVVNVVSRRFYFHSKVGTPKDSKKYTGFTYIVITAIANHIGGSPLLSEEHSKFQWVHPKAVFEYDLTMMAKKALSEYLQDNIVDYTKDDQKLPIWLSARALIQDNNGKYLLVRRSKQENYQYVWEIPGGKLKSLETMHESLRLRVFEETGLVVEASETPIKVSSLISKEGNFAGFTYINIIHTAEVLAGKVVVGPSHDKFGWFSRDEIFKLNLAPYIKMPLTEIFLKVQK